MRRFEDSTRVLRALQGVVLNHPNEKLAERILQLNRFPLILSLLSPTFADAPALQLEALRGLCASAASVPRYALFCSFLSVCACSCDCLCA